MVMRYGSRIWKLRVMQAEIKMTIRSNLYYSSNHLIMCEENHMTLHVNTLFYSLCCVLIVAVW